MPPRRCSRFARAWTPVAAFAAVFALAGAARAASVLSPDSLLAAQQAYDRGDSIQAARLLSAWSAGAPADPRPGLLRLEWNWWRILEGRDADGTIERGLRRDFAGLETQCEMALARHPEDWIAAYALGEAHCAIGRLDGLSGSAWGALRHHQKGIALLTRVQQALPGAPEPGASIALFRYYAARLPASVRVLARLVRVRGDRRGGLAGLRAAASAPGLQQTQARFFLVQILNDAEDANLEALDVVLRLRMTSPRRVPVILKQADILADLDRPDLAVQVLSTAASAGDSLAALEYGFLAGRIECETGRFEAAARRFDGLGPQAGARVTWIAPWLALYRAEIAVVRGDDEAARQYWNAARSLPDAAGSRGAAEAAAERFRDPAEPERMAVEEALAWDAAPDTLRARTLRLESRARHYTPRIAYTRGSAWLRLGEEARAVAALEDAGEGGEDAWLVARTATRLLVARLRAGDQEAAARQARRILERRDEWGVPAALVALAQTTLEGASPEPPGLELAGAGVPRVFRVKDCGFAAVSLEWRHEDRIDTVPLALSSGWWSVARPVPPGGLDYAFRINRSERTPDPAGAAAALDAEGRVWSCSLP